METIRDLFLERKSYIIEYKLNEKYYLFIEMLNENGCDIFEEFNENLLIDNLLVELHSSDYEICEWYDERKIDLDCDLKNLENIMNHAIMLYESDHITMEEFNDLTNLDIEDSEIFDLIEDAFLYCRDTKKDFCETLMADFTPYSQMLRNKDLNLNECLYSFMNEMGYVSRKKA